MLHVSPALVSVHHVCAVLTKATRGHWIPGAGDSDTREHYLGLGIANVSPGRTASAFTC